MCTYIISLWPISARVVMEPFYFRCIFYVQVEKGIILGGQVGGDLNLCPKPCLVHHQPGLLNFVASVEKTLEGLGYEASTCPLPYLWALDDTLCKKKDVYWWGGGGET